MSEEALPRAEEREWKAKKKRYLTECRVPENSRRENVYLSEQCKEIEKNNRKEKTRELFKKKGDIKATFHVRIGTIKDRNGKHLREAEEVARIHRRTIF